MATSPVEQVLIAIDQCVSRYHRLVLIVGPTGSGKTAVLEGVAARTDSRRINLNLELAKGLLELTSRQRVIRVKRLIEDILADSGEDAVLLDNIELVFDQSLKQDPFRLLLSISRNRTIVATWNGIVEDGQLIYASPDHHEYRRYAADDALIVMLGPAS
jgi:ABC-type uncharacterized transport system ATPase component